MPVINFNFDPADPLYEAKVSCGVRYPPGSADWNHCVLTYTRHYADNQPNYGHLLPLLEAFYGEDIPNFKISFSTGDHGGLSKAVSLYSYVTRKRTGQNIGAAKFEAIDLSNSNPLTMTLLCKKTNIKLISFGAPPAAATPFISGVMNSVALADRKQFAGFDDFFGWMEAL